jgi:hypothetical protein
MDPDVDKCAVEARFRDHVAVSGAVESESASTDEGKTELGAAPASGKRGTGIVTLAAPASSTVLAVGLSLATGSSLPDAWVAAALADMGSPGIETGLTNGLNGFATAFSGSPDSAGCPLVELVLAGGKERLSVEPCATFDVEGTHGTSLAARRSEPAFVASHVAGSVLDMGGAAVRLRRGTEARFVAQTCPLELRAGAFSSKTGGMDRIGTRG